MPSPQSPSSTRPRGRTSRPSSFHGRLPGTPAVAEPFASAAASSSLRRPKTVPVLHAATRHRTPAASPSSSPAPTPARVPSKVLVSVTVLRSLGALQVVASTDWTVTQLVSAAVKQYVKEARRPLLQGQGVGGVVDPKDYALHYSQFSLQPIPEEEKLIRLGSRSFFLCPKCQQHPQQHHMGMLSTAATASPPPGRPRSSTHTCSNEAHREDLQLHPKTSSFPRRPWLRFIDFLL